jgi:hypothetical protein
LFIVLPGVIAAALAAMRPPKRQGADFSSAQMHAVLDDELRRHSLNLSYRNAFFAMLIMQPVLAIAVTTLGMSNPVGVMAGLSALAGAVVALASLLYYDR